MDHVGDAFLGFRDLIAIVTSIPVHGPFVSRFGDGVVFCAVCFYVAWNSFCRYVVTSDICISSVTHQIPVDV